MAGFFGDGGKLRAIENVLHGRAHCRETEVVGGMGGKVTRPSVASFHGFRDVPAMKPNDEVRPGAHAPVGFLQHVQGELIGFELHFGRIGQIPDLGAKFYAEFAESLDGFALFQRYADACPDHTTDYAVTEGI